MASCKDRKYPGGYALAKELTQNKKTEECQWLNKVSSVPLRETILQLHTAFQKEGKSASCDLHQSRIFCSGKWCLLSQNWHRQAHLAKTIALCTKLGF